MAMPKTAVDKDHLPARPKNDVRLPGEVATMQPVSISKPMKDAPYDQLGSCVLLANRRHEAAALWRYSLFFQTTGRHCRSRHLALLAGKSSLTLLRLRRP